MEFNCASHDKKTHFFYDMTQNLKTHVEDKELERIKVKNLLIAKLGKTLIHHGEIGSDCTI